MTLILLLLTVALVVAVLALVRARAGADETVREAHDARKAAQQTGIRITRTTTSTDSLEITGWGPGHGQALERLTGAFGHTGAAADQLQQWGSGGGTAGRHAVEPPRRAQLPPVYQSTADVEADLDGEFVERPRQPRADDGPYTDWAGR